MFQRGDSGSEKDSEQVGVRHEDRTLLPLRGQEGARRDSALPTRESPLHCPLVPPSIGHALCPIARRLLAAGHAPLLSPYSHWLLFHVPLSEFPIGADHTLSFVTRLHLQYGFLPQPSFIHSASSAGCLGHAGESDASLSSVQEMVEGHGPRLPP